MAPIIGITASANSVTASYCFARYFHGRVAGKLYYSNMDSNGFFNLSTDASYIRQNKYNSIIWRKQGANAITGRTFDSNLNTFLTSADTNKTVSKVNSDGTKVWSFYFPGVASEGAMGTDGTDIFVAGTYNRSASDRGIYLRKLDTNGSVLWQREIKRNDNALMAAYDIVYDNSSNSIVLVTITSIIKISASTGSVIWFKDFVFLYTPGGTYLTGFNSFTVSVNQSNGNISFGCKIYWIPSGGSLIDYGALITLNSSGNIIWSRRYGNDSIVAPDVATDANGNVYGMFATNTTPMRSVIIKWDSSGNQLWSNYLTVNDALSPSTNPSSFTMAFQTINTTDDTIMFAAGKTSMAYFLRVPADGSKRGTYTIYPFVTLPIVGVYETSSVISSNLLGDARMDNVSYTETATSITPVVSSYNAASTNSSNPDFSAVSIF
jgi:hypothetical protein